MAAPVEWDDAFVFETGDGNSEREEKIKLSRRISLPNAGRGEEIRPTPIQARLIPVLLRGSDAVAVAQTGSGKTDAYILPALTLIDRKRRGIGEVQESMPEAPRQALNHESQDAAATAGLIAARDSPGAGPLVLVVCPTRELAMGVAHLATQRCQVSEERAASPVARVACVYGGVSLSENRKGLRGADVLVATPGRLLMLLESGEVTLGDCEMLVFDEFDRLLDMGFAEELAALLHRLGFNIRSRDLPGPDDPDAPDTGNGRRPAGWAKPPERDVQVCLCSATRPRSTIVDALLAENHARIDLTPAPRLCEQHVILVSGLDQRFSELATVLESEAVGSSRPVVVIAEIIRDADVVRASITRRFPGRTVLAMYQPHDYVAAAQQYDSDDSSDIVVVTTPVALRGMLLQKKGLLIHFTLPLIDEYFHNIGRPWVDSVVSFFEEDRDARRRDELAEVVSAGGNYLPSFLSGMATKRAVDR
jgi:superfamily II DNA/RNA helicase